MSCALFSHSLILYIKLRSPFNAAAHLTTVSVSIPPLRSTTTRYKWLGSHRYLGIPLARFRMQPEQSTHTAIQRVVDSFDLLLSMTGSPNSSALPAAAPGDSDPPTDPTTAEAAALAAAIAAAAAKTTVSGIDTARDYYAFKGETVKLLNHIGTVLNGILLLDGDSAV